MKKLIKLLGLQPLEGQAEVSEDQIVAAVKDVLDERAADMASAAKVGQLLGLERDAQMADVAAAIAALKKSAAGLQKTSDREAKITALVQKTGMQRTDAEHTIDQQAKEDAARASKAKGKK